MLNTRRKEDLAAAVRQKMGQGQTAMESMDRSALNTQMKRDVRPYLDLIDGLRSVGIKQDVEIPQIVVVGDQSSGKSSVLEALSGVPFPRGAGLVTKCATELRMKNNGNTSSVAWRAAARVQWGTPNKEQPPGAGAKSTPEELGKAIEDLTAVLTEKATFCAEHSIVLELESPDVPDLTIIDLPGIVRTPVQGQTGNVMNDVHALIAKYLKQQRTIMLAVIPANVDVATVDILERAKKQDKTGDRTIGVLTKPDLVDRGGEDEVLAVLENVRKPLQLGYVMVKNRSQEQIIDGMSLDEAKRAELNYFRGHRVFKQASPALLGIYNLTTKLTAILVSRIKSGLPSMKKEIQGQLVASRNELEGLGSPPPSSVSPMKLATLMYKLTQPISSTLRNAIYGDYSKSDVLHRDPTLQLYSSFLREIEKLKVSLGNKNPTNPCPKNPYSDHQALKKIRSLLQQRGREPPGFLNKDAFVRYVQDLINLWRQPTEEALENIKKRLLTVGTKIIGLEIRQFSRFRDKLVDGYASVIESLANEAQRQVNDALEREGIIFTISSFLEAAFDKMKSTINQNHTSNAEQEVKTFYALLTDYYAVASARFLDVVGASIIAKFLNPVDSEFDNLVLEILEQDPKEFEKYFEEDEAIRRRREDLTSKLNRLESAIKQINAVG